MPLLARSALLILAGVAALPSGPMRVPEQWTLASMTDAEKLHLFERLPVGSALDEARALAPDLHYDSRSRAWESQTTLLGQPARFEVLVDGDSLYAWCFRAGYFPSEVCDSLLDIVVAFYAARFGEPQAEDAADPDYFVKDRRWCVPGQELGVAGYYPLESTSHLTVGVQATCWHAVLLNLPGPDPSGKPDVAN